AGDAAGHDVVPALVPSAGHRYHVVEGELRRLEAMAAILAAVLVPRVDVGPGKGNIGEGAFHPDVTEQAEHRRQLHPDRDAANLPIIDGDHLDLALEEERDGLLPRDDPQWLVAGVQDEGLFHGGPTENCALAAPGVSRQRPAPAARASRRSRPARRADRLDELP